MKKILLATSAVALFAGAAAAEVTTTGTARMGIVYDGTDTFFSSRFRVIFTASGESDSGFSFGASVRNDQSGVGNEENGDKLVHQCHRWGNPVLRGPGGPSWRGSGLKALGRPWWLS